jgi:hypothetical protein
LVIVRLIEILEYEDNIMTTNITRILLEFE